MQLIFLVVLFAAAEAQLLANGCPEGQEHLLLPHETDCSKFYYCNHGEKVLRECSGGLHFDPILQVCNWPNSVQCSVTENPATSTDKATDTTTADTISAETTTTIMTTTADTTTTETTTSDTTTKDTSTVESTTTTETTIIETTTTDTTTTETTTTDSTTTDISTTVTSTAESTTTENTTADTTTTEYITVDTTTTQSTTIGITTTETTTTNISTTNTSIAESTTIDLNTTETTTADTTTTENATADITTTTTADATTTDIPTTDTSTAESATTTETTIIEISTADTTTTETTAAVITTTVSPPTDTSTAESTTTDLTTTVDITISETTTADTTTTETTTEDTTTTENTTAVNTTTDIPTTDTSTTESTIIDFTTTETTTADTTTTETTTAAITTKETTTADTTTTETATAAITTTETTTADTTTTETTAADTSTTVIHPTDTSTVESSTTYLTTTETTTADTTTTETTTDDTTTTETTTAENTTADISTTDTSTTESTIIDFTTTETTTESTTAYITTAETTTADTTTTEYTTVDTTTTDSSTIGITTTEDTTTTETTTADTTTTDTSTTETTTTETATADITTTNIPTTNTSTTDSTTTDLTTTKTTTVETTTTKSTTADITTAEISTADTTTTESTTIGITTTENTKDDTTTTIDNPTTDTSTAETTTTETTTADITTTEYITVDTATTESTTIGISTTETTTENTTTTETTTADTTTTDVSTTDTSTAESTTIDLTTIETTSVDITTTETITTDTITTETTTADTTTTEFTIVDITTTDIPTTDTSTTESTIIDFTTTDTTTADTTTTETTTAAITTKETTTADTTTKETITADTTTTDVSTTDTSTAESTTIDLTTIETTSVDITTTETITTDTITTETTTADTTTTEFTIVDITTTDIPTTDTSTTESTIIDFTTTDTTTADTTTTETTTAAITTKETTTADTTTKETITADTTTTDTSTTETTTTETATTDISAAESTTIDPTTTKTTTADTTTTYISTTDTSTAESTTITLTTTGTTETTTVDITTTETTTISTTSVIDYTTEDNKSSIVTDTTITESDIPVTYSTRSTDNVSSPSPNVTDSTDSMQLSTTTIKYITTTDADNTTPSVCPPGTFGNVPHPDMCNSYYLCTGGVAIQLFCQEGQEFDPETRTCVTISNGGCSLSQESTTSSVSTTTISEAETTTEWVQTTTPSVCPPGTFGNVPHPDMCNSYYLCTGGVAIQLFCQEGQEFDPETRSCVPIASGGCTYGQTTTTPLETPDVTSPELSTTTGEAETTTEWVQTTTPSVCPPGTFGNVPHPDMCNSYYLCTGGVAIQLFCQEGQEFDPETRACTPIGPGGCTFGQTSTADSTSSTDHSSTSAVTDDTTQSPTITSPASICPDVSGITLVVPHPDICESFYVCVDGAATQNFCPEGYEYDTNQWSCVPIAPGGCTYGQTTTTPLETPDVTSPELSTTTGEADTTTEWVQTTTPSVCPPGTFGNVPHPDMCNSYYLCTGGVAIQLFCQEGQEFDPETRACTPIGPGGCTFGQTSTTDSTSSTDHSSTSAVTDDTTQSPTITSPASICPDVSGITLVVPHPDICESFYVCVDGAATQNFCPEGYEYDTNQWSCVPIAPGGCTYGQTTTTPLETPDVTSPELSTTTGEADTTTEWVQTTTPSVCPPGTFGNVPHPDMCNSYYLCTGGVAIQLFCQEGQEFDPETRACTPIGPGGCTFGQTSTTDSTSSTDHSSTSAVTDDTTQSPTITSPASICPDVSGITLVVPHPDICESFYVCVDGAATQNFCPEGYEYDTNQWSCVPIAPGGCTYGQTTTTPLETPDVTSPELSTTTGEADTTTEWVQTTTPSVCPPGTFGNVPHPDMCNSYYLCTGGVAIQLFCQEGQEFDPETRACTPIGPGGCTFGQTSTTDSTSSTDHSSTSAVTDDTTQSPTITSPASICPDVSGITLVVPHPDICESFYVCVDGAATQNFCPEGYEYDTNQWSCVPIAPGGCTYGQTTTTPLETPDVTSPELSTTTGEADTTTEWVQTTTPSVCPPGTFGNVPHPDMCNSYYLCTGGVAIQLFCQEGQEFDPETRSCVPIAPGGCTYGQTTTTPLETPDVTSPELSTTTGEADTTTEWVQTTTPSVCSPGTFGNVPHPDMCNSYYLCTGGVAIQLFCQEGQEFDPETRACTQIGPGGCTFGQTSTADSTSSTDHSSTSAVTDDTTQSPTITSPASICPDVSGITLVVPHPDICESFYVCVDGAATQNFCPEGYEYDTNQWSCVPIAPGGCTYSQTTTTPLETPDVTSPELSTTTGEADTTTEWVQTTTPSVCPPGTFGNVPHPDMCNSYYLCTGGVAIQLFCQEGQEFDPETRSCVPIASGGCTYGQTTTTPLVTPDVTSPELSITTGEADTTTEWVQTTTPSVCPPGTFGNVPHPDMCNSYYLCTGGVAIQLFCQEGQEFDPETRACTPIGPGGCTFGQTSTTDSTSSTDHSSTSAVTDDTTQSPTITSPASICPDVSGITLVVPHPDICESFYVCVDGAATQNFCPEGYEYDTNQWSCVPIAPGGCTYGQTTTTPLETPDVTSPELSTTTGEADTTTEWVQTTTPSVCPPGTFGNVPHPDMCNSYYLCTGGVAIQLFCQEGQEFDPETRSCVPIAPGGCTYGQTTTTPLETPDVTSPELSTTTGEADTTTEWVQTTTPSVCPPGTFGNVPHPDMCNSYYLCTGGVAIQLFCQEGQEFDPETRACTPIGPGGCTFGQTSTTDSTSSTDHSSTSAVTDDTTQSPTITSPASICPDVSGITLVVPHPDICESFYVCVDGAATQNFCPEGYEYDTNQWSCVPIAPGGCTYGQTTTTPLETPDVTSPELTTTTGEADTTTEWVQTTTPSVCPPGTFGNVPHPDMCNSYYLCTGGVAIQLFCQEGQEFDPETRSCVPIASGGCTYGQTTTTPLETPDVTSPELSITTGEADTTTEWVQTTTPSVCPPGTFGNVPHPDMCNSYYLCTGGVAIQLFCQEGQEFDPETRACTQIGPGGCTFGQTSTTDSTSSTDHSSTSAVTDDTTQSPTITSPASICPDVSGITLVVPHPDICESFYVCVDGAATQNFCPEGYEYDTNQWSCVPIAPGGCTYGQTTTTPLETPDVTSPELSTTTREADTTTEWVQTTTPSVCPPGTFGNVPHPDMCNSYYLCTGGVAIQLFCQEGQEFDPETRACTQIGPGGCTFGQTSTADSTSSTDHSSTSAVTDDTTQSPTITSPASICPDVSGITLVVPHPDICESFYVCVDGAATQNFCPEGYEYDTNQWSCVPIAPGGCTYGQTTTTPLETPDVTSPELSTTTGEADTTTEWVQTTTPSVCPPGTFGNVPHPDMCNSYYLCTGGVAIQLFCQDGHQYDHDIQRCVLNGSDGCTVSSMTKFLYT